MGSLALHKVRRRDGSLVLSVAGIVDDDTVECFELGLDRATAPGSRQVIVDLTTCQLDSAGLAALVRLWRRSRLRSAGTRLVVPDFQSFRMLQLVGLTSQFPTYRSMDAALPSPAVARSPIACRRAHRLTSLDGAAHPFRAVQRGIRAVRLGSRGGRR